MKLRKVVNSDDSWQRHCRWCKHFINGCCYNSKMNESFTDNNTLYEVSESGQLSEVIEETLQDVKLEEFRELEYKLREWRLSEKRIKEFLELFKNCYDDWSVSLRDTLDENISRIYLNYASETSESEGVSISDPDNFCCEEWE